MSTTPFNKLRRFYDLSLVILCAIGFILLGVTATLAMCNASSHAPEMVASARVDQQIFRALSASAQKAPPIAATLPTVQPAAVITAVTADVASQSQSTVVRASLRTTTYANPLPGTFREYVVQRGDELARLNPNGWQHTCVINVQRGFIKASDCKIIAGATILLPVAIVIALSQEQTPQVAHLAVANKAVSSPREATKHEKSLDLDEKIRLAEKARRTFCYYPDNERLTACEPERDAQTELQRLALLLNKRSI